MYFFSSKGQQLLKRSFFLSFLCTGPVELAAAGVSIALFNQASRITIFPLVSITTSFVAEEDTVRKVGIKAAAEKCSDKNGETEDDMLEDMEKGEAGKKSMDLEKGSPKSSEMKPENTIAEEVGKVAPGTSKSSEKSLSESSEPTKESSAPEDVEKDAARKSDAEVTPEEGIYTLFFLNSLSSLVWQNSEQVLYANTDVLILHFTCKFNFMILY